ncbi:MAG: hypothetical protein ACYTDW_20465 [Planctomycetota bacterium]|jgi:hypothetical protein
MKAKYGLFLILMLAAVITVSALPCWAQGTSEEKKEEKKEDIWTDKKPPGTRRRPRLELKDEEIDQIIKSIKESNPEKAKELEKMREEIDRITKSIKESDPEKAKELEKIRKEKSDKFQSELREHGRDEFGKIVMERIEKWRKQRREEFLKWLDKNFRRQAEELKKLIHDPDLYLKKFEIVRRKYWDIFEAERRNPELGKVLKEKLRNEGWRDRLLREIRAAKTEKKKKELINKLKEAVGRRLDLIVREKQIYYKRLRERLEELKKRVEESQAEIDKLQMSPKSKKQNIDKRVEDLLSQKGKP